MRGLMAEADGREGTSADMNRGPKGEDGDGD